MAKETDDKKPLSLPAAFFTEFPVAGAILTSLRATRNEIKAMESFLKVTEGLDSIKVARAYVVLHFLNQCIDETTRDFSALFERFKREVVPTAFENDGVTHVPLSEGFRVAVSMPMRVSIREGKREEAYAWLRGNGLGSLIGETVNSSTLAAAAKSLLEDSGRDLPAECFNVALVPGASVTRTAKK